MKRTLFDNYDIDTYLDMAKESMEYDGIDDASEEEVWQYAGDLEQEDLTKFRGQSPRLPQEMI